jgi:hypothetical protein
VRSIGDSVPGDGRAARGRRSGAVVSRSALGFGVNQRLDNQIINGDGNAPNLTGIVNKSGIQTQAKRARIRSRTPSTRRW